MGVRGGRVLVGGRLHTPSAPTLIMPLQANIVKLQYVSVVIEYSFFILPIFIGVC